MKDQHMFFCGLDLTTEERERAEYGTVTQLRERESYRY